MGNAALRVLNASPNAEAVDIYLDDDDLPHIYGLSFPGSTGYVEVPSTTQLMTVTVQGVPIDEDALSFALDLSAYSYFTAVIHGYADGPMGMQLDDQAEAVPAAQMRYQQFVHVAPDVGQVNVFMADGDLEPLVPDLDYTGSQTVELPVGAQDLLLDIDGDDAPDLSFSVPDLGGNTFMSLYVVNEVEEGADEDRVFLLAQLFELWSSEVVRVDADRCGDGVIDELEFCDEVVPYEMTCEDLGLLGGALGCSADCMGFDSGRCFDVEYCTDDALAIPDSDDAGVSQELVIADAVGAFTEINIYLDVSHSWLNDLDFEIQKDGGTTVLLADHFLAQDTTSCGGTDMLAILGDAASISIVDACDEEVMPAIDGYFIPQGSLADFDGDVAQGTWKLSVSDSGLGDSGQVNHWCVRFDLE
nr:DUF4397 domain-containing protein [Pseudenhygromyxa sp. WMMC2535]